jgi:hypothetical protein
MNTSAHRHRPLRLLAVLSGGLSLVLTLAAASPSSLHDAVAGTHAAAGTRAAASGGIWGQAEEVPGTAALNKGGFAQIFSVSCASKGNCSAGGFYEVTSGGQAFVAGEAKGIWGQAEEVPGIAALNKDGFAEIFSVSCGSKGNCSAGGFYTAASGPFLREQAFVVGEAKGIWGQAEEVPGTATLNKGGDARITSVSCASKGNCSAGGSYLDASGGQAFVAGEAKGIWGQAQEVPGIAALNNRDAGITSVSCASAGNCSAGGFYADRSGRRQVFVVGEANGIWGRAEEVPGAAALNKGRFAGISSASCASKGNCSAGGFYEDASGRRQAFVVGEAKGIWGQAQEVPGTAALNKGGRAGISSVSCASTGNCSAGGFYTDRSGPGNHGQAFVVGEAKGIWAQAEEVPGSAALNKGGEAGISSVSCASAGNCSAGGSYLDGSVHGQAFVVGEAKGIWGQAEEVPGTAGLNKGGEAGISSVSCASKGNCSAGGDYGDRSGRTQVFVVNET